MPDPQRRQQNIQNVRPGLTCVPVPVYRMCKEDIKLMALGNQGTLTACGSLFLQEIG